MSKVFVIAEAGVNHNGKLENALELVDAAKQAGADAVKFQLFDSKKLWGDGRIKHLELRYDDMEELHKHCEEVGIEFMCTPFGVAELTFLQHLLKRVKIASGCITRKPLLEAARDTGLPIIISTGMSDLQDIVSALILVGHETPALYQNPITLLHCTSSYPCRLEDVNLLAMTSTLQWHFARCAIGYSDHTSGITVPIAAVARGAVMIEKHFTLDRNQEGPDHKASITPREFKAMRIAIGEVETALGDGVKRVMDCELWLRAAWRGN